jgi:hypothetical protein
LVRKEKLLSANSAMSVAYQGQNMAIVTKIIKAYTFKESIKYKKATSANIKHCNTGVNRHVLHSNRLSCSIESYTFIGKKREIIKC